ncbi:unnamed protein product [Paramecium sonneborni]|uniref:WD domain, G-beta repeat protein n=1 Tax=Paramecium sonneborni TaxID=65129 RepID=A0A8S1PRF9_9CILI|nr:unnamed protein product [Paramecium sonneborni]
MCEEELDIDRITKKKKLVQCQKTVQFACLILKRQISNQSQIKEKCQKQQIQYQQVCTIKQEELCCALSFYHDASLMVVSSKKLIKVFQISNCQFQLIQTLNSHQGNVCCLKFMKKSYRFISGGQDKQIIIWSRDDKQQYFCEQQLKGHSYSITCLELNRSENLIISGSMDDKIKFWILQDEWIQSEIFINHEQPVQALSLSKSEQLLVSCSNNVILLNQVINQGDFQVQQIQKIDLLFPIYRISFINNNIFVFQSSESKLQFYVKENNSLKFFSGQEIQIQPNKQCYQYSPSIYLNEKDLLFFKSGQSINIIKNVNDKQFIVQQSIQLKAIESFIAISEDSQYMGIWDQVSKEIQIRKAI